MAQYMWYVRIDRDGDLSIAKGIKNPWKFSWLEEEQNIEDLLVTPSSKKVYYRDFLEKINKRGFAKCMDSGCDCLLKYVEGGLSLKDLKCRVATKKHWNKTKLRLTNYGIGG